MKLQWDTDSRRGWQVEVAKIGRFEAVLTCTGAGTIGVNVCWIAQFNGELVAVAETRDAAIEAMTKAITSMLFEAGAVLGGLQ